MKKRFSAAILALALCLGLAVPALAAEGDVTTITDEKGYVYNLSKPLVGTDTLETGMHYLDDDYQQIATNVKVYLIEEGTIITPKDPIGTPKKDEMYGTTYYLTDEEGRKEAGVSDGEDYTVEDFTVSYCALYGIYDGENTVGGRDGLWMLEPLGGGLDGLDWDDKPIQPLKADEFNGTYVVSRTISWSQIYGHNGGVVYTESYAYVKVLTAEEAAEYRAEHGQEPAIPKFTDVPEWCAPAVGWAVEQKITDGKGNNKFAPGDACKQGEILTFLWRAAGCPDPEDKAPVVVESYYQDGVDWAYGEGLVDDTSFVPGAPCTRGSAMLYIWNAFGQMGADGHGFNDIPPEDEALNLAVNFAAAGGIANGFSNIDGTYSFRPNSICSRGHIVTFLYRAYVPEARLP